MMDKPPGEQESQDSLSKLQEQLRSTPRDWRKTIGMFSGDAEMKALFSIALKVREANRLTTRR